MLIAKIEGNIITVGDYRELFPEVSFSLAGPSDEWLDENGCKKINMWKAHDSKTEKLVAADPYIDGDWVYTVQVEDKTAEEIAADVQSVGAVVRATRNQLLSNTDWTQLADAPVDKEIWASYRQGLRDIPSQAGFPQDVTWPEQP